MRVAMNVILLFTILLIDLTNAAAAAIDKKSIGEPQKPTAFQARSYEEDIDDDYDAQAQTPIGYRARAYDYSNEENEQQQHQPRQQNYQVRQQPQQHQQQYNKKDHLKKIEEELEEEEPDRLAILLAKSSFNCNGKTTGYYADDSLNCEVFHYCQENSKHSWICPEGFSFHQVHLICMPPSGENICEQSSKYHVVNEYLYKPLNLQEHQSKPNVTLKYSDRYFPENFYENDRYEADDRISHSQHQNNRQPVQVGFNVPQRKQTSAPIVTPAPLPYRFASPAPVQTVYRSPEEINISLQQRRPQYFVGVASSSTPRYVEEDYSYEK